MNANSTGNARPRKPSRPKKPKGSPFHAHLLGYWSKKVKGKLRHYGRWGRVVNGVVTPVDDVAASHMEALKNYEVQLPSHLQGREAPTPSEQRKGKLKDVLNKFLTEKLAGVEAGKLSRRSFDEYKATAVRMEKAFGGDVQVASLGPDDFTKLFHDLERQYGPVRLGNEIQKVKTIFKLAETQEWIPKRLNYGAVFKKPSGRELRLHRLKVGARTFDPATLRQVIDAAGPPLRAIVLLGINAGLGCSDVGRLRRSNLNLDAGWLDFPRPKTGIGRRCWLWPETVAAIRDAVAEMETRRATAEHERRPFPDHGVDPDLVFVTRWGRPWATGEGPDNAVTGEFTKLLRRVVTDKGKRKGLSFYRLRHTLRTVGDAAADVNAIRVVMGHVDGGIDANYTHGIADARVRAVAEYVRRWLYPDPEPAADDRETGTVRMPKRLGAKPAPAGKTTRPTLRLYAEGGAA